jgi:hypothetical protein
LLIYMYTLTWKIYYIKYKNKFKIKFQYIKIKLPMTLFYDIFMVVLVVTI